MTPNAGALSPRWSANPASVGSHHRGGAVLTLEHTMKEVRSPWSSARRTDTVQAAFSARMMPISAILVGAVVAQDQVSCSWAILGAFRQYSR